MIFNRQETVMDFIKRNKLKPGVIITDGDNSWEIKENSSYHFDISHRIYLHSDKGGKYHIGCGAGTIVSIPNLKVKPKVVRCNRYVIKEENKDPFITKEYFADYSALVDNYGGNVEWCEKLKKEFKDVEIPYEPDED